MENVVDLNFGTTILIYPSFHELFEVPLYHISLNIMQRNLLHANMHVIFKPLEKFTQNH